jgi:hypothetical protein
MYRIALICGIVDPGIDHWQDRRITVSPVFRILGVAIPVSVPHSKIAASSIHDMLVRQRRAIPRAAKNVVSIQWSMWYQGILLPINVAPDQVHCLADVRRVGGVIFEPARILTTISKP